MSQEARRVTGQWIALDVNFAASPLGVRLLDRFGPAGPYAWVQFLCACKRSPVPGQLTFTSDADALAQLGLTGARLVDNDGTEWGLETFWRVLGQLKQTKRTVRGRVVNVRATHWEQWQDDTKRRAEQERKRRWWAEKNSAAATVGVSDAERELDAKSESESESEIYPPKPPLKGGAEVNASLLNGNGNDPPAGRNGHPDGATAKAALAALRSERGWTNSDPTTEEAEP